MFGEFPTSLLSRLSGGDSYKETIVTDLKQRGLIKTYYDDGLRGLRPTSRAKKLLLADNPQRVAFYLKGNADTNHVRSEPHRRERLHRIAEASVTMKNAGASIFRDEHPAVFAPLWKGNEEIKSPAFYTSREIKESGEFFSRTKGARAVGALLTEENIFITYNLSNSLMKWNYRAEMRNKAFLQTFLCLNRLPEQYSPESISGIMLANSMWLALDILSNANQQYLVLDNNFENFYFVTNDKHGEMLISLLCNPEMTDALDELLLNDLYPARPGYRVENDAMTEDDEPVLLAYKCDLKRIKKFYTGLKLHDKRGIVYCFDYQAEALRCYCGDRVEFKTLDFNKTERRFFS